MTVTRSELMAICYRVPSETKRSDDQRHPGRSHRVEALSFLLALTVVQDILTARRLVKIYRTESALVYFNTGCYWSTNKTQQSDRKLSNPLALLYKSVSLIIIVQSNAHILRYKHRLQGSLWVLDRLPIKCTITPNKYWYNNDII